MRRIGILTFHKSENTNYGAILQTYATYSTLEKFGFSPIVIDWYKSSLSVREDFSIWNKIKPKNMYRALSMRIDFKIKVWLGVKPFEDFSNKYLINKTKPTELKSLSSLNLSIDDFVVGSDQVWRYYYSPNIYKFFLDFVELGHKRIAYAASFGIEQWSEAGEQVTSDLKKHIKQFDAISVREDSGIDICRNTFGVDAIVVLDPTLLLSDSDYIQIINNEKNIVHYTDYVASLFLSRDNENKYISNTISKELGCKNVYADGKKIGKYSLFNSIPQWLSIIRNSKLVITDSFHCVAFSIIFNKNFICISSDSKRGVERFRSILSKLGLLDRLFVSIDDLLKSKIWMDCIDYDRVNDQLNLEREKSIKFLISSINK